MKRLIVYYSLEGNTDYAAKKLAELLGADLLRLWPKKAYKDKGFAKFFWGGKSAVMAESPELEPYAFDAEKYEGIVFGFPVWAGTFTPPLRSFAAAHAQELRGKHLAAFACQSGAGGEKALAKLAACIGVPAFEQTAIFVDPKARQDAETDAAIEAFAGKLSA